MATNSLPPVGVGQFLVAKVGQFRMAKDTRYVDRLRDVLTMRPQGAGPTDIGRPKSK